MHETLADLLLDLPADIQRAAVMEHLRRLHANGETDRLRATFSRIRRLGNFFLLKADAVHFFLLTRLRRQHLRQALALYRALCALETRVDPHGCRRADALWHLCRCMLPQAASRLGDLWHGLSRQPLAPHAQYLCARSGLLLLEAACACSDRPAAEAILHVLRRLPPTACRTQLTAAEARFQKAFAL